MARVLVVDDEPDIRTLVRIALERAGGLEVEAVASGAAAIEAIEAAVPEVVLLDVMMPGLDGLATLERIRDLPAGAGLPVVFLTARAQQHEVEGYRAAGARSVIVKPFEPRTLVDEVRTILGEAR